MHVKNSHKCECLPLIHNTRSFFMKSHTHTHTHTPDLHKEVPVAEAFRPVACHPSTNKNTAPPTLYVPGCRGAPIARPVKHIHTGAFTCALNTATFYP